AKALVQVLRDLDDAGIAIADIGLRRPTLAYVFLSSTRRPPARTPDAERRVSVSSPPTPPRTSRTTRPPASGSSTTGGRHDCGRATDVGTRPPRAHRPRGDRPPPPQPAGTDTGVT